MTGCEKDCGAWSEPEALELGAGDLHAVAVRAWDGAGRPAFHAVGVAGRIVTVDAAVREESPVDVDLRGVAYHGDSVIVVGDAGTVLRGPVVGDDPWQEVEVGVTQDLHAFVPLGASGLALGDDVLVVHDGAADTWVPTPAPPGGWGALRAGFIDGYDASFWVVGLAGVAWTTYDLGGAWERVDLETEADLVAAAGDEYVFGSDSTILQRRGGAWREVPVGESVDFIAAASTGVMLTADGRLLRLRSAADGGVDETVTLGAGMIAAAIGHAGESPEQDIVAIVAGAQGRAVQLEYRACEVRL